MIRSLKIALVLILLVLIAAACGGFLIGPQFLHPLNRRPKSWQKVEPMFRQFGVTKEDFTVPATDKAELQGWKLSPAAANGEWVILYHGVGDSRTGMLGAAQMLVRNGYSVVMMDSRAHGDSGGDIATYGWKERYDTVAIINALYAREKVRHLFALGVSMGAAIALQSAAVEPRIEGVVAEDPFANIREVSYDYTGFRMSPFLGKTFFRPASITALMSIQKLGGFSPDNVSPERAVQDRAFPVLLICGTQDHAIPCRHDEMIYQAAIGPKELWIVKGAGHAAALGHDPAEYEKRVVDFFSKVAASSAAGNAKQPSE